MVIIMIIVIDCSLAVVSAVFFFTIKLITLILWGETNHLREN